MTVAERLRRYIVDERFAGEAPPEFHDDFDLIDSGTIDSLFMVGVINFIEREYRLVFGMNDLIPRNFKSVNALARYVEERTK